MLYLIDYYYLFATIVVLIFTFFSNLREAYLYKLVGINFKNETYHNENFIYSIFTAYKIILFFILFYFIFGFMAINDDVIDLSLLMKNMLLVTKILFFIFIFIFIFLFEFYVKLVNWINSEIMILFMMGTFALSLILFVKDFLNFYLLLEIYSLAMCGIMGLSSTMKNFIEASFKYFIMNAVSSSFILFGMSVMYMYSGSYEYNDIIFFLWNIEDHMNYYFFNLGMLFFLVGFFIKLSLFPFNYWVIDVYENTSLPVTFFLLIFPKFMFTIFFCLTLLIIFFNNNFYVLLILFVSLISFMMNNIIALYQIKLKKLLICSSLANAPFFFLPIYIKTFFSFITFYSFFIVYFFNLYGVFIFMIFFYNWSGKNYFFKKMSALTGFVKNNKILSYIMSSFFLSLAGLPPFSGFFAKFYFLNLLMANNLFYLFLLLSFINLMTVFYYLRLVKLMFQNKNYQPKLLLFKSFWLLMLLVLLFLMNIFFIFYFQVIFNFLIFFVLNFEWIYYS